MTDRARNEPNRSPAVMGEAHVPANAAARVVLAVATAVMHAARAMAPVALIAVTGVRAETVLMPAVHAWAILPFAPSETHWNKPSKLCASSPPSPRRGAYPTAHRVGATPGRSGAPVEGVGSRLQAPQRQAWVQAVSQAPSGDATEALLRLEIAADVPTPAAHLPARRALQLQMLTRRNDPAPAQTWAQDAARVLSANYDTDQARRLQSALKGLLKTP